MVLKGGIWVLNWISLSGVKEGILMLKRVYGC